MMFADKLVSDKRQTICKYHVETAVTIPPGVILQNIYVDNIMIKIVVVWWRHTAKPLI